MPVDSLELCKNRGNSRRARLPGEGRGPGFFGEARSRKPWIPAFAGMTVERMSRGHSTQRQAPLWGLKQSRVLCTWSFTLAWMSEEDDREAEWQVPLY